MSEHHPEIIIIKRKGGHAAGHHGGAWKIAFADFMTAMMAFFLVLWIINATDKDTKTVIARYFNPTKLENPARARKGVHGVDDSKIVSNETTGEQTPGTLPPETKRATSPKNEKSGSPAPPAAGVPAKKDEKPKTPAAVAHPESKNVVDVKPTMSETALFSDPYKALDKIVGGRITNDATAPGPETGDAPPQRLAGGGSRRSVPRSLQADRPRRARRSCFDGFRCAADDALRCASRHFAASQRRADGSPALA